MNIPNIFNCAQLYSVYFRYFYIAHVCLGIHPQDFFPNCLSFLSW